MLWAMTRSEFEDEYDAEAEGDARVIRGALLSEPIRLLNPAPPLSVASTALVADALKLMKDKHIGCVLVIDDGKVSGIFTERDVLQRVAGNADILRQPVSTVMTANPDVLGLEDGIAFAMNEMVVNGYRHIPIVDKEGRPVGIISVRDIVKYIVSLFPSAVLNLPPDPTKEARSVDGG